MLGTWTVASTSARLLAKNQQVGRKNDLPYQPAVALGKWCHLALCFCQPAALEVTAPLRVRGCFLGFFWRSLGKTSYRA